MKKLKIFILLISLLIPACLVGCKNENKNTLSTPSIENISGGTIIFNSVADAEYYTISINDTEVNVYVSHSNNVEIIDNKINYDASKIFVKGDSYTIKVKANSSKKNSSNFSSPFSYKHIGTIAKPSNIKINSTTLTWDTVENAVYYLVKIITPNDTVLFDKEGNVLPEADSESILKADLTEYSFNSNQFDFGSLLTAAGKYKFFISAVMSDNSTYVQSNYTEPVIYSHVINLQTPKLGTIKADENNDLILPIIIDPNANSISIKHGNIERSVELNTLETSIVKAETNLLNVNLNKYFKSFIDTNTLNLSTLKQYGFSAQAKYVSNMEENKFYLNSPYSNISTFENTLKLSSPVVSVEYDNVNDCYLASWNCSDSAFVNEYKLYVFTSTGVKEMNLSLTSKLIYDDFIALAVQAIGVGNVITSDLSAIVANPTLNQNLNIATFVTIKSEDETDYLEWENVEDGYYVFEFNDKIEILTSNRYILPEDNIYKKEHHVKVTAIKENYQPKLLETYINYDASLDTPTFAHNQGFNSKNLYELTFTGVDEAFGYYVYIKSKDATDFVKINKLYTTTAIDLSQYVCTEGNYTDYQVCVQAVADPNSVYSDSNLSASVSVSHVKTLAKPEFYKIGQTVAPVTKQVVGDLTKYILKFYGVEGAGSYEILVNYNKITQPAISETYEGVYEVDISNFLIAANNYEIKVKAIPSDSAYNVQPSEFNITNYSLTKQLTSVQNINISENEGVYTLSFDPIDNAESYRVRIVKENDSSYMEYLSSIGLSNSFETTHSIDVSKYVKKQGVYYFYVTALAPKQNSYYADANESTTYGHISKLTTLEKPANIEFNNIDQNTYMLSWKGDNSADYYLIKLVDPNNAAQEFKVYNATNVNINKYMTIQGTYNVSIYSMVNAIGENSKEFTSSSAGMKSEIYAYQYDRDFLRYSVYMYGTYTNFMVEDIQDLKNLLWYHYLYEIDSNIGLSLMLHLEQDETIRDAITRLATEANDSLLYNFANDETWLNNIQQGATDNVLFTYLCKAMLKIYPEFNVLEDDNLSLSHTANNQVFTLKYKNKLNGAKIDFESSKISTLTSYGNDYSYIDIYSRKSPTGIFNIDTREEMLVTTTEQLLQAVQHNRKPKFIGNSATAETVYNNAKLALSAIISNNMSDLEKVTAIFDWLEYGFDLSYYTIDGKTYTPGTLEIGNAQTYGQYKHYYLEGMFENISLAANGNVIIGSNIATSWSYSKAFALLCAIEGIDAAVVNGNYTYYDTTTSKNETAQHVWNKVYLSTSVDVNSKNWYSLDLTFSDNRIYYNNLVSGYGISSHAYFLTTDNNLSLNLKFNDNLSLISSEYKTARNSKTNYNYYSNSSFALTYNQIASTIMDFAIYNENNELLTTGFEYSKEFNPETTYQKYASTNGYGALQAFLLNSTIYASHKANLNSSHKSMFEFRFNWDDNGGSNIFNNNTLISVFETAPSYYGLRLALKREANGGIYTVQDTITKTTTVIFTVEKTA